MQRPDADIKRDVEGWFPSISSDGYIVTSEYNGRYNCIAYAAGVSTQWWWPDTLGKCVWPIASRELTVACFIEAFRTRGYEPCGTPELEVGFEKVAIYAINGEVQHAARQLPSGAWTSKLGMFEDIEHTTLTGIEGTGYGYVAQFMKRQTRQSLLESLCSVLSILLAQKHVEEAQG